MAGEACFATGAPRAKTPRRPPTRAFAASLKSKPAVSDVVVIGAGVAGACTALALLADGYCVTVVDPRAAGGDHAASYGNGRWLSTASVVPMSLPGLWKNIPRYLLDADGPLVIRAGSLPRLAPWLVRFLAAGHRLEQGQPTSLPTTQ